MGNRFSLSSYENYRGALTFTLLSYLVKHRRGHQLLVFLGVEEGHLLLGPWWCHAALIEQIRQPHRLGHYLLDEPLELQVAYAWTFVVPYW